MQPSQKLILVIGWASIAASALAALLRQTNLAFWLGLPELSISGWVWFYLMVTPDGAPTGGGGLAPIRSRSISGLAVGGIVLAFLLLWLFSPLSAR